LSQSFLPVSLHDSNTVLKIKRFRPLVALIKDSQRRAGLMVRPLLVSRYMKAHSVRKLQIGAHVCVMPGWLNTDLYPQSIRSVTLDATKRFPFLDASFDYVFSEHQLEHIGYEDALVMLGECRRILRPEGKIRIALPSLDRLLQLFGPTRTHLQERYIRNVTNINYPNVQSPNPCFAINSTFMNWGHRFIWDQATLSETLESKGFARVQFFTPGQSDDPNLSGIETRTSEMDKYETMVAQAVRV
jgi:predicted SAM-dependent methyltransferase